MMTLPNPEIALTSKGSVLSLSKLLSTLDVSIVPWALDKLPAHCKSSGTPPQVYEQIGGPNYCMCF